MCYNGLEALASSLNSKVESGCALIIVDIRTQTMTENTVKKTRCRRTQKVHSCMSDVRKTYAASYVGELMQTRSDPTPMWGDA